ncbi:hypothetical protein AS156_04980 [Bradyrhizobium macuxiense]|uniref:Uncharacterized protein n=1 Tax=Bradyrhizobium macuxiense TaxID=1755647 RepID=A0A109JVU2_9BRAD|nr:hypothetical protein AS156_04980 [Bradyrhizobium macuxiense]
MARAAVPADREQLRPTILKPAGLQNAKGAISATPTKSVGDPEWADDPACQTWLAFMKKCYPEADIEDQLNFTGWNIAVLMTKVIEACGDDLSRQNIMKHATGAEGRCPSRAHSGHHGQHQPG